MPGGRIPPVAPSLAAFDGVEEQLVDQVRRSITGGKDRRQPGMQRRTRRPRFGGGCDFERETAEKPLDGDRHQMGERGALVVEAGGEPRERPGRSQATCFIPVGESQARLRGEQLALGQSKQIIGHGRRPAAWEAPLATGSPTLSHLVEKLERPAIPGHHDSQALLDRRAGRLGVGVRKQGPGMHRNPFGGGQVVPLVRRQVERHGRLESGERVVAVGRKRPVVV